MYLLEIGAAVAGTFFLKKIKDPPRGSGLIISYLWLVVFVEFVGLYPAYAYFSNYTRLAFIEGTPFERNYWWFNIYNVVKILMLSYFFILQLVSPYKQKLFRFLTWIITFTFILDLLYSGSFFTQYPMYTVVMGALYIILLILMYLKELMESDRILHFYKSIAFYISIGMLVWHAIVTPLHIYSKYFSRSSPEFLAVHSIILHWANVILYGIMILGFLVCLRVEKEKGNYNIKRKRV